MLKKKEPDLSDEERAKRIKNDLGRASESRERILAEWTKRHATAK
jgi:hypothetical protein